MHTISAYIIGLGVAVLLLIVSAIVSSLISYRPDNTDCKQRKLWFWVFSALAPVLTFLAAFVFVYLDLKVGTKKTSYMTAMSISSVVSFVIYAIGGFVLAKINKHGKIGNWF